MLFYWEPLANDIYLANNANLANKYYICHY